MNKSTLNVAFSPANGCKGLLIAHEYKTQCKKITHFKVIPFRRQQRVKCETSLKKSELKFLKLKLHQKEGLIQLHRQ